MYQIEWEREGDSKRVRCGAVRAARSPPRFSPLIFKFPPTPNNTTVSVDKHLFAASLCVCVDLQMYCTCMGGCRGGRSRLFSRVLIPTTITTTLPAGVTTHLMCQMKQIKVVCRLISRDKQLSQKKKKMVNFCHWHWEGKHISTYTDLTKMTK